MSCSCGLGSSSSSLVDCREGQLGLFWILEVGVLVRDTLVKHSVLCDECCRGKQAVSARVFS